MTVREIQEALKSLGFDPGPIDGIMGSQTRDAVKAFQRSVKVDDDGIVGPITMRAFANAGKIKFPVVKKPGDVRDVRKIHTLVWHCTATPEGKEFTVVQIDRMHRERGFTKIGYHKLFHLDGGVSEGRPEYEVGAHVSGHNTGTIGYSYVGGVDKDNKAKDTRTPAQKESMLEWTKIAARIYKLRAVVGHRDLSPDLDMDGVVEPWEWVKQCPCFNVIPEYGHLLKE